MVRDHGVVCEGCVISPIFREGPRCRNAERNAVRGCFVAMHYLTLLPCRQYRAIQQRQVAPSTAQMVLEQSDGIRR